METKDTKYNGWTNYETWNIKLWIDNDQGSSEYWQEQAQQAFHNATADKTFTHMERAALDLMDTLKEHFENQAQDVLESANVQCSWIADLLNSAISEANWHEIAESLLEDVDTEA